MPPTLQLRLLGDFSLTRDDTLMTSVNTPRLQSLLAYLAIHRDAPQLRQHLAFLFWPESSETQARNNLRQLLHALRHTLPDINALLLVDNRTIHWRRDVALRLDVEEFERALEVIERAEQRPDIGTLHTAGERMLALYQADLLPGCYDEWVFPERDRLRERFTRALGRLITAHEARHDFVTAIHYARRLIRANPLDEEAHRALMRLLALNGDRAGELRAYQACDTILRRELGIGPSQTTDELHQRLQRLEAPPAVSDATALTATSARQPSLAAPPSLVGRTHEWETLQRAWQMTTTQGPGFVLISGEPGIGKTRLAEEMAHWASAHGIATAAARSYAVEGQLSFAPVIEWLRSPTVRPQLQRLETVWLTELARVLPELLAEMPDLPHYEPLTEYGQRQRFFQALALAVLAAPQPLLLVIDDLQWCDQETLEWLHFLLRFDAHARLLVLGIARTGETSPEHPLHALLLHLRHTMPVTEMTLPPLDAAETAELAARMIDRELDTASAMRLFGETEGNPLFVVETVRGGLENLREHMPGPESEMLAQSDTRASTGSSLLPGVRAVIAGRLAQLSAPAREVAALAATVGREFDLDILARVSHVSEERIVSALDELWARRIVREQGSGGYDFTHDKLREVAYAEISAPQRHLWHRHIAQALESLHPRDLDPFSGQIAAHYERGGSIERAIPFYHRAAIVAQRSFALEDAIHLLRHCLALLEQTPGGVARDQQELRILLSLAPLYRITRGWTAPELEHVVERILALCDTVGDDTQRAEALHGLQSLLVVQARLERVQLVAEDLHALYERMQGTAPALSDMMSAGARLHMGRLRDADDGFRHILLEQDNPSGQGIQAVHGWNSAVHTRAWHAHALWCLGYPERAIRSGVEGMRLAQSLEQPFNQALAVTYLAMLSQMTLDTEMARARAEEALALTAEYKAPYYHGWATVLMSYALAREHPDEERIAAVRTAIDEFTATGVRLRLPYYLSLLASVYQQAERAEDGLQTIEEALAESRASNERWWDAELHRLRGEMLFAAGRDVAEAEAALIRAVDIARSQRSRMLGVRALLSLACLQRTAHRTEDAWHVLGDWYSEFTEGFDTPDLRAAREFLQARP